MAVFVTGGTGYLGQALLRMLRIRGKEARALVRPRSDVRDLDLERLETVIGDVRDASAVRTGMAGCRAVVHAAALTDAKGRARDFEATNVQGFRNVMEAAWHHKIPIVIHVSSYLAMGPSSGGVVDEEHLTCDRRSATDYERTVRIADQLARSYVSGGVPLSIVYPGQVYGPGPIRGGNHVSRLILKHAKGGLGSYPGDGAQRWSPAFIDDVAEGICKALERARSGSRYILAGEPVTVADFFATLEEVSGLPAPRPSSSLVGAGARMAVAKLGSRFSGKHPLSSRLAQDLFRLDWAYDSGKARNDLGYSCRPLQEGLKRTLDHLVRRGLLG